MLSLNGNSSTPTASKAQRLVVTLLATLVMMIMVIGSGTWSAQASTLGGSTGITSDVSTQAGSTQNSPDAICPPGGQCFADVTPGNPFYAFVNRIFQQDLVSGYACGGTGEPCDSQQRPYYRPLDSVTRQQMAKFIDNARHLSQIDIEQAGGNTPIVARNNAGTAIGAYSTSGQALVAQSTTSSAIYAQSGNGAVITAFSTGGANSVGVYGSGNIGLEGSGIITGVLGVSGSNDGYGVYGKVGHGTGVYGYADSGAGVIGYSAHGAIGSGVSGSSVDGAGVQAHSDNGYGLFAASVQGEGVRGDSGTDSGVHGLSSSGAGVYGESDSGNGMTALSTDGFGIYAASTNNFAGRFEGDVYVHGNCCSSAQSTTEIDDPLDPTNKTLTQSVVQSPNMMDMLDGNVTTDANGDATVQLPAYFQALNTDFRYQLTVIGQFSQAIISSKVNNNSFGIKTDKPSVEVSWQVTGVRQDPYAKDHPIVPEQNKPATDQGKYLYPAEYGQPASSGVDYTKAQQAQRQVP